MFKNLFLGLKKEKKGAESAASQSLNLDNDYFLVEDGRLVEYRGSSDTIVVPRGVRIIGRTDVPIWNKTIHCIFIPRSVYLICESALPYVETVYYEGSQEQLQYKQSNFNANGWVPDWSKTDPERLQYHVNEVSFHYNDGYYDMIAKSEYEKYPDQLKPKSSD